jgi:4a-hydroxytetrahydrobiopterin dehydratase
MRISGTDCRARSLAAQPRERTAAAQALAGRRGARSGNLALAMSPPLSDGEVRERLERVPQWGRADEQSIQRDLTFEDFRAAIAFVNRVADAAEQANHHPDILVHGWNKVRLTLSTHSEGGLTAADFDMAARIDTLL